MKFSIKGYHCVHYVIVSDLLFGSVVQFTVRFTDRTNFEWAIALRGMYESLFFFFAYQIQDSE